MVCMCINISKWTTFSTQSYFPIPCHSVQIYPHVSTVKYERFNLTGVCWTVCCQTCTTCSTVHIHSLHKKYIFVYTAFTISYNRAVAGTSVWMDVLVMTFYSVHRITEPLIIQRCKIPSHNNVSYLHIWSSTPSPTAVAALIGLYTGQSRIRLCSCPSVLSRPLCVVHITGLLWSHWRKR